MARRSHRRQGGLARPRPPGRRPRRGPEGRSPDREVLVNIYRRDPELVLDLLRRLECSEEPPQWGLVVDTLEGEGHDPKLVANVLYELIAFGAVRSVGKKP